MVGVSGHVTPGDDSPLVVPSDQVLANLVQAASDPPPPVLGIDHHVGPVVPLPGRVVVGALMFAGDLGDGVLGMVEVEVEEDPGALAGDPVSVEHHEESLREHLRVDLDVLLVEEVFGLAWGKAAASSAAHCAARSAVRLTIRMSSADGSSVPDSGHQPLTPGRLRSRCRPVLPNTPRTPRCAGRITAAPADSL